MPLTLDAFSTRKSSGRCGRSCSLDLYGTREDTSWSSRWQDEVSQVGSDGEPRRNGSRVEMAQLPLQDALTKSGNEADARRMYVELGRDSLHRERIRLSAISRSLRSAAGPALRAVSGRRHCAKCGFMTGVRRLTTSATAELSFAQEGQMRSRTVRAGRPSCLDRAGRRKAKRERIQLGFDAPQRRRQSTSLR